MQVPAEKRTVFAGCRSHCSAQGVTSLLEPSGCGKTTLLRAIAGLEKNAKGFLHIGRETWQDDKQFIPAHRRPLGYVFQEASLFEHLTVRENVA